MSILKHNLTLAFFCPKDNDHIVNRLVAKASKHPYCHVELYFDTTNQAFSIMWGESAALREKNFSSTCYDIVTLDVTMQEYTQCLQFCRTISKENITFDDFGMWSSYFYIGCCLSPTQVRKKTFCSKIICEALQYAGVREVAHVYPNFCTPSRLYANVMKSSRRICASVPYKCQQLLNKRQIVCFNNKMYFRLYNAT
jgi:hypothetical protein